MRRCVKSDQIEGRFAPRQRSAENGVRSGMKRAFAMTALGMLMVVPGCFVACPQTPAQSPAQTPPPSPDPSQPQSPAQTSPAPQPPAARPAQKKPTDPGPQPTTRIDVAPLG